MFSKCIVAAVVCRNCHDGSRPVACQYVVANPDWNGVARKRIDGIGPCEHAGYFPVRDTLPLGAFLRSVQIGFYLCALCFGRYLGDKLALRRENHECYAEHRVCACREDGKFQITILYAETNLRSFRATYPIALRFLQRIRPIYRLEPVEQSLRIGRDTQAPLAHLFLHHGIASACGNAFYHLVIRQDGA